jgi:hypothetical protein
MGRQIKQKQDGFVKPIVNPDQFRSRDNIVAVTGPLLGQRGLAEPQNSTRRSARQRVAALAPGGHHERLIAALAYLASLGSVCGYLLWFHLLTVWCAVTWCATTGAP